MNCGCKDDSLKIYSFTDFKGIRQSRPILNAFIFFSRRRKYAVVLPISNISQSSFIVIISLYSLNIIVSLRKEIECLATYYN